MIQSKKDPKSSYWTTRKRTLVTTGVSLGILCTALLIGSSLYTLGRLVGLFPSQSLKTLTRQSLVQDSAFRQALEKVAKTKRCENSAYQIVFEYYDPLVPLETSGSNACLKFELSSNPNTSQPVLSLKLLGVSKQVALDEVFQASSGISTHAIPHNLYEVTKVKGIKAGVEFESYVIPNGSDSTWIISLHPMTHRASEAVSDLVRSFRRLNSDFTFQGNASSSTN